MSDIYAKLQALDITLPALATPAAAYVTLDFGDGNFA